MKISDYIIDYLIKQGVNHIFGIPGGVVLDFVNSASKREEIRLHLNFHEQCSAYAAVGFSQVNGKLCVAYSTKGPGLTNMITAIADAYYDSIPSIFITSHSKKFFISNKRSIAKQEFDSIELVNKITKYSACIESSEMVREALEYACNIAITERPGPVFLDFLSGLFSNEI
jgi:acetolactate synthase-1/2/3 large subunit